MTSAGYYDGFEQDDEDPTPVVEDLQEELRKALCRVEDLEAERDLFASRLRRLLGEIYDPDRRDHPRVMRSVGIISKTSTFAAIDEAWKALDEFDKGPGIA